MRSAAVILAGLLVGVLVALGVLAAFLFVGPDPVGLRPTPSPSPTATASPSASPSVAASASASPSASSSGSAAPSASAVPSASAAPTGSAPTGSAAPSGSAASQTALDAGPPAPPLVVAQVGGDEIDLAKP